VSVAAHLSTAISALLLLGIKNAIRPTAVGKKNWLFVGEAGAGQRGAIIYTLIESCRRRNIDPYAYLKDALTRLPHK
jgi:hypothetical protein